VTLERAAMKVYFSHGKESGPWGSKIKRLANKAGELGFSVDSIDYTDTLDPDKRVSKLVKLLEKETQPYLLVGSSMGGYVSLVAADQTLPQGLFLLAPALYIPTYQVQNYAESVDSAIRIEVVHGWNDEVIPFDHSVKFSQHRDCFLHLISGDHRLNDSIIEVERLFAQFLECYLPQAN
jgi:alpha/beta superfamily hydrolase